MRVEPTSDIASLRFVQGAGVDRVRAAEPVAKSEPARSVDPHDVLNFEAMYRSKLPKANVADAIQRLDQIRAQLVAARTAVPVHFADSPAAAGAMSPHGAVARTYLRFAGEPASINAAATEAAALPLDETA